jgi:hypothetical protein
MKRLAIILGIGLGAMASTASAAQIEFRGALCFTATNATCVAQGWNTGCYSVSRYAPRRLGDNGEPTRLSFFDTFFAENYTRESGDLVSDTFRTVTGTAVGRSGFQFTSQMKITTQQPPPSKLTAESPSVAITGSINDFDGIPGCNVDFKASGINTQ